MLQSYPIYTHETECQDCYKCVRQCPVKAIKVENNHAAVIPELCVACGHCVEVCPARAKHIRNDLTRAKHLLQRTGRVYVSLAPSWPGEFPEVTEYQMVAALKALGVAGVSETALGAQEVSAALAGELATAEEGIFISSACPVTVELVRNYVPKQHQAITRLLSPALTHGRLLRDHFGDDIAVIFIGPCIAKKLEADAHPEILDLALTYRELRHWMQEAEIDPAAIQPHETESFVPQPAEEGAIYPIEGGMAETIKGYDGVDHVQYLTLTGVAGIRQALEALNETPVQNKPVFLECLACDSGCISGPGAERRNAAIANHVLVESRVTFPPTPLQRKTTVDLSETYSHGTVHAATVEETTLRASLKRIGKYRSEDELNCSGCGYETCRAFAQALLEEKAEPSMCVSYLLKQSQKKANALLRCMPSGVVIADASLHIVECNDHFAHLFIDDYELIREIRPDLKGAALAKIVPFGDLFQQALDSGDEIRREHYRHGEKLFNITIFSLETHRTVGAIIADVTGRELRREEIAQRANTVIKKNLGAVQEIACLLGEHMADTELLLRSITEDYGHEPAQAYRLPEKDKL